MLSENENEVKGKAIFYSPTKSVLETPIRSALKSSNYNVKDFLDKMTQLYKVKDRLDGTDEKRSLNKNPKQQLL